MTDQLLRELRRDFADNIAKGLLDYPTALAIQNSGALGEHDPKCSANPEHPSGMGGPHFLCDCDALVEVWEELAVSDD